MTSIVALFGDPVASNPTSQMHNAAFRGAGLDWVYVDIRVPAEALPDAVSAARTLGFAGLNLTIPHKVAVVPLLDVLEASAEITGAVNTVKRETDGRLVGLNTDGLGFLRALIDVGINPAGATVVLLGAGGAARAVAVELALAGAAAVVVANRSAPHCEQLVALLRRRTRVRAEGMLWAGRLTPPRCDLLVNCTPIGMGTGATAAALPPVDIESLAAGTVVCDLNPDRAESAFVRAARARGLAAYGGLPMLARQGAAGYEAWTGLPAPLDLMVKALEDAAGPNRQAG